MLLLPFQIVWRVKSLLSRVEPGNHFPEMELTQMERERGEGGEESKRELKDGFMVGLVWLHAGRGNSGGMLFLVQYCIVYMTKSTC